MNAKAILQFLRRNTFCQRHVNMCAPQRLNAAMEKPMVRIR